MASKDKDEARRLAYSLGIPPKAYSAKREMPDGKRIEAHEVELAALGRIALGEHTAWDALAAEALAEKCAAAGCIVTEESADGCPGWRTLAIAGFEGWVMSS